MIRTKADWNFETTPQEAMAGRKMYLPRGKMLGGCSAISKHADPVQSTRLKGIAADIADAQIYQHCAPSDYDYVRDLVSTLV